MKSLCLCLVLCTANFLSAKEEQGREHILSLVSGEWVAQSLYTAAELDIATHLQAGPKSVSELAQTTGAKEEPLYRLLRLLASVGVFHEEENRFFSNTDSSVLLVKGAPDSLRSLVLFYRDEMGPSWRHLSECVKEGKPAFNLAFGQPVFSYFREHAEAATHFQAAMREKSRAVVASCLQAYDFKSFKSIYDIGGGSGHFLKAILTTNLEAKGVLFELPEVLASVEKTSRLNLQAGDFFKSIPEGGDCYLLKSILHDWSDADAVRILSECRKAMSKEARLVIVEPIMVAPNEQDHAKVMDVYMMAITGGKERTLEDFKTLLSKAGFSLESVTPTATEFSVIVGRKN